MRDVVPRGNALPLTLDGQRRVEKGTSSGNPRREDQSGSHPWAFPPPFATPGVVAGDAMWRRAGPIGGRVGGKHCHTTAECRVRERYSPSIGQRMESHPMAAHTVPAAPGDAAEGY